MKKILIFMLLLQLTLFISAAQVSIQAPAVSSDGQGIMATINVKVVPGDGSIFVNTEPFIGIQTQNSERTAAEYAARHANVNKNSFDYLYKITTSAEVVDGPSAGAAMALITIAALENRQLRSDFSMTGTINRDGSVGSVGGIFEKATAAHAAGIKLFMIPKGEAIQSGVDVRTYASLNWGMTVYEASDIGDVLAIAFSSPGETPAAPENQTQPLRPLNLTKLDIPVSLNGFKNIASKQLNAADNLLKEINNAPPEYQSTLSEAAQDINTTKYLLDQGYPYSAANTAFLTLIDLKVIKNRDISIQKLKDYINDLQTQVFNTHTPQLTKENFEWTTAGQLRLLWADRNLQSSSDSLSKSTSETTRLTALRDTIMAEMWISAAQDMFNIASQIGGTAVGESGIKTKAKAQIDLATNITTSAAGSSGWHLAVARTAYTQGKYLAAYWDSTMALAFSQADNDTISMTMQEIVSLVQSRQMYDNGSWPNLYSSHSLYLLDEAARKSGRESAVDSLRISYLAQALSSAFVWIPQELSTSPAQESPLPLNTTSSATPDVTVQVSVGPTRYNQSNLTISLLAGVIIGLILLFVLILYARGRKYRTASAVPVPPATRSKVPATPGRAPTTALQPTGTTPETHSERMLEMLEERLAEGKISEETYNSLKSKYEARAFGPKITKKPLERPGYYIYEDESTTKLPTKEKQPAKKKPRK